eukprot:4608942-Amphidinium_carterae.1
MKLGHSLEVPLLGFKPMSTTSGTAWLTCLLQLANVYGFGQTLGTHSAKATILSWCAKQGLDASDRSRFTDGSVSTTRRRTFQCIAVTTY